MDDSKVSKCNGTAANLFYDRDLIVSDDLIAEWRKVIQSDMNSW